MDLTEAQWWRLDSLLPKPRRRPNGRGRPWRDPRDVLNGILWVMRTGAPWHDLSVRYRPYQTCHRCFQLWVFSGTICHGLAHVARELAAAGGDDFAEGILDATFVDATKVAPASASPATGKAPRS